MNALCLVIDGLHVGYLGAFGNTWIETPWTDRMAWESFVLDQAFADSTDLAKLYRGYWSGQAAFAPRPAGESLASRLREIGVQTLLVTDESDVAAHPLADHFDQVLEISPPTATRQAARAEDTTLARAFAELAGQLEGVNPPYFCWCHLRGLTSAWDAPAEYRQRYREPGDPAPLETIDVPSRLLPKDYDPDELLLVSQAYAAQVTVLDECLEALGEYLQSTDRHSDTLQALIGARGFALGEHLQIGADAASLYNEHVHVPWMIRFADTSGAGARSQALVEPADLYATLVEAFGLTPPPATSLGGSLLPLARFDAWALRDRVSIAAAGSGRAIRTPGWYLIDAELPELFAKPDDFWEATNVASRYGGVVEGLREALNRHIEAAAVEPFAAPPPLDEWLLNGDE